jgi:hypothetical protein
VGLSSSWLDDEIEGATRSLGTRTYSLARPVDLWTVGGVANSLKDGCLSGVCFSDDEDTELDIWSFGKILLCSHSANVAIGKTGQRGGVHSELGVAVRDRTNMLDLGDTVHLMSRSGARIWAQPSCTFMHS